MTPNFQRFYALVKEKYGDNIPQELRNEFRAASKPLMKYTNILTFNTRAICFVYQFADWRTLVVFCIRDYCNDFFICIYAPLPRGGLRTVIL